MLFEIILKGFTTSIRKINPGRRYLRNKVNTKLHKGLFLIKWSLKFYVLNKLVLKFHKIPWTPTWEVGLGGSVLSGHILFAGINKIHRIPEKVNTA